MDDGERFDRLVADALDALPEWVRTRLENVAVVVEDGSPPGRSGLLGLFEGIPQSRRGGGYSGVLPDRITLFYRPLIETFRCPSEIREQIRRTVVHEVAHFLGLDDDEIERLGY